MHLHKIDTSLQERHDVLRQLARLKEDNISIDELEEIGASLKRSGKLALRPLVRKLWLENSGDLFSRYTYLLDFFEDESLVDQLIQVALKRRDLGSDAKAALLAALEGFGVDVRHPPFLHLHDGAGKKWSHSIRQLLDRGEEGMISFMEEFLLYSREGRLTAIGQMSEMEGTAVVALLEALLWLGTEEEKEAVLTALGRIRTRASADLLKRFLVHGVAPLKSKASRSLRRLAFVGVDNVSPLSQMPSLTFDLCCAGPPDGDGYRTLTFSRSMGPGTFALLCLQLHEVFGIAAARGSHAVTFAEQEEQLAELRGDEEVVPVDAGYALRLMQDALHRNRETGTELPAEFYVYSGLFCAGELVPTPYEPALVASKPLSRLNGVPLDELADDPFFSCWFMTDSRVYDYAGEWRDLEEAARGKEATRGLEIILERFCKELFPPKMELIQQRLLLIADLMRRTGRGPRDVETVTSLAHGLGDFRLPYHLHPFLRRFALESMDMAREVIVEGFDIESCQSGNDEWDD